MNRNTLLVIAVLAALGAGTALAATQADDATRSAARINPDKNNDGAIDRAEAAALPRLADKFDALDKNKDGKLTADERPQRGGMHGGRHGGKGAAFAKLDTNQDGKVSRAEAGADPKFAERFDKMDVNKDGVIDRTDREVRAKQHREERFAAADTDKDGKLSRAEFEAADSRRHHR
ncbi:EF-hand domain-containing protein [Pseudoxanthomonas sp. UTMC 1351]|uniref:EF-hand domain-containing protein n=1 Tax=Pseudoxanthomonas sp. UTMC 1351 TaxID=2695853 RepID=UPI0034CD6759